MHSLWLVLAAYTTGGFMMRALNIWVCRYIQWESDGGGWDSGSTFSFYPDLPRERCLNAQEEWPGAWTFNDRQRLLMWALASVFGPIWMIFLGFNVFAMICWFIDKVPAGAWRDNA